MLTRYTPLRRHSWMRRSSKRSAYKNRERNIDHMLAVKRLACCARDLGPCRGPVEADHAGRRALGRKCPDEETIPLCSLHHTQRASFSGVFRNWTQLRMRVWLGARIEETQATIAKLQKRKA